MVNEELEIKLNTDLVKQVIRGFTILFLSLFIVIVINLNYGFSPNFLYGVIIVMNIILFYIEYKMYKKKNGDVK